MRISFLYKIEFSLYLNLPFPPFAVYILVRALYLLFCLWTIGHRFWLSWLSFPHRNPAAYAVFAMVGCPMHVCNLWSYLPHEVFAVWTACPEFSALRRSPPLFSLSVAPHISSSISHAQVAIWRVPSRTSRMGSARRQLSDGNWIACALRLKAARVTHENRIIPAESEEPQQHLNN